MAGQVYVLSGNEVEEEDFAERFNDYKAQADSLDQAIDMCIRRVATLQGKKRWTCRSQDYESTISMLQDLRSDYPDDEYERWVAEDIEEASFR